MMSSLLKPHVLICLLLFPACLSAQEINDQNTPLHLMQPEYATPYGIPTDDGVDATLKRVMNFLEGAIPSQPSDNRLPTGSFRLTSYEAGVLYSACLASADADCRRFAEQRLLMIAKQSQKEAKVMNENPQYDPQMRMVLFPDALDDCGAMATAYCKAYLGMAKEERKLVEPVIERYVGFILDKQYRLADGTFARKRPRHNTVWLDDMYMGIPAMAWYARYLQEKGDTERASALLRDAIQQVILFRDKMWVEEHRLFRHGWVESMSAHPAYHWGRANGWAILTLCELLDAAVSSKAWAADEGLLRPVKELLQKHVSGLAAVQDKTGFWHQLLDRPDTYLETSCTAIYAYCMAHSICEGWIDAQVYGPQTLLAWQACQTKVNTQGQVEGTCVGTGMGFDPAFYAYRPVHKMAAHGYGPVIWAGNEVKRLLRTTHPKMNDSAVFFYPSEQKTSKAIFYEDTAEKEILW